MAQIMNLETNISVEIGEIEQQLSQLWKSASQREGEGAVMRACSCNLIILTPRSPGEEDLSELLETVARSHPCRSIVIYAEDDRPESLEEADAMKAWISTQCYLPYAGGPQICCEAITIVARGEAVESLPDTALSLLVPDLPVFLYWRSLRPAEIERLKRFARFSGLLIVDSHHSKDDREQRRNLLRLLVNPPLQLAVRDLNWSRLTAWRDLIAECFDPPGLRSLAREVSTVEISRVTASTGGTPTRALLLTGWLADRLGWELLSAKREGDRWESTWSSPSGELRVIFSVEQCPEGAIPGIRSVHITTRQGTQFAVVGENSSCMTASTSSRESTVVHSVPVEIENEAILLANELSISGEDQGLQRAMARALELELKFE